MFSGFDMTYLILILSMAACLFGGVFKKYAGDRFENKNAMYHAYNAVVFLTCTVSLLIIGGIPEFSIFTFLLGVVFGVVTALQSVFILKAYENGPFSYTSVIVSLSTIIPTLSGCIFWNEKISALKICGIALMFVCFVCSVDFSGSQKGANIKWIIYAVISFISTGVIGVMQKIHQTSAFKDELDGFLMIAFVISFVYSLCFYLAVRHRQNKEEYRSSKNDFGILMIIIMIISGICVAVNNKANLYLSGVMDSAVFFPTVNGGGLILSALASLFIFKEKLTLKKWIGVIIGIVAVIMLCI